MDRLQLQQLLEDLLESPHVYFQPPANVQMTYPCITYKRDRSDTRFAGNVPYRYTKRYLVTVIDQDPDSAIPDKIAALPKVRHERFFVADNLNHDVFTLFI